MLGCFIAGMKIFLRVSFLHTCVAALALTEELRVLTNKVVL